MKRISTSIRMTEEARDILKKAKITFRYSSMEEFIIDSCSYFLNYNQSPKEIKEPIGILFNKFSDRFFGAFNKTNKEILNPFIKDSYTFYNKVLENIDNTDFEKEPEIIEKKEEIYNKEESQELKKLILELDKLKNNTTENGVSYFRISVSEYNKIMDKIKMM